MEVPVLRAVKQEPNQFENFPQPPNHTFEKRYHDPPEMPLPLAKILRTLNPHGEEQSATAQSTPDVQADDHVHQINGLELPEVDASDEVEEPPPAPNVRISEKAQLVAEMVDFAFDSCEGSNFNPGTRMMVAKVLQFLSKQYEEDKALAIVEIERLKDEHLKEKMNLEEERKVAIENLKNSASELERVSLQNEELKERLGCPRDLEREKQELRTTIVAMGKDMDALKNKHDTLQNEFLSARKTIEELKKSAQEKVEHYNTTEHMQHVKVLLSKIDMQNREIMVLRDLVSDGAEDRARVPPKSPHSNLVITGDNLIQNKEQPVVPKRRRKGVLKDGNLSYEALRLLKFEQARRSLLIAMMALGKTMDTKMSALFSTGVPEESQANQWKHCMSRIIPYGYQLDNSPCFKHVWNHWIYTIMFYDFEATTKVSLGMTEASTPEHKLGVLRMNLQPGCFNGCSQFQAFVKRKYHSLFPHWFSSLPLMKILDDEVYSKFMIVAERVWRLCQIAQCCDPPMIVFRPVALATQYDSTYHKSISSLSEKMEKEPHLIMLTFIPGFRVGDNLTKSEVLVKKI